MKDLLPMNFIHVRMVKILKVKTAIIRTWRHIQIQIQICSSYLSAGSNTIVGKQIARTSSEVWWSYIFLGTHLLEQAIILTLYALTVNKRTTYNKIVGQFQHMVCVVIFVTKSGILPKSVAYPTNRETPDARGMQVAITWGDGNKEIKRTSPLLDLQSCQLITEVRNSWGFSFF